MTSLIRRRWLVVAVLAGASAGCSLIADLSQFDGYVDAATDGGGGKEVGIDKDTSMGSEESTLETGTDDASDAGPPGDGASPADADASIVADVNTDAPSILGNSWCSQNFDDSTVLCADFDEPRISNDTFLTYPYGGQWMVHDFGGTDGLDRVDYAPGSAPNALEVVTQCTTATPTAGCVTGYTQEQLIDTVVAPHGVIFSYAVKIENYDLDASDVSTVIVGSIPTGASQPDWYFSLDYHGGNNAGSANQLLETHVDDAGAKTYTETTIAFPDFTDPCLGGNGDDGGEEAGAVSTDAGGGDEAGAASTDAGAVDGGDGGPCIGGWVNVVATVDLLGTTPACALAGGPCVALTYNGQTAFQNGAVIAPIAPPNPAGGIQIVIGANYIQAPAQTMTLLYDNVKVEALP